MASSKKKAKPAAKKTKAPAKAKVKTKAKAKLKAKPKVQAKTKVKPKVQAKKSTEKPAKKINAAIPKDFIPLRDHVLILQDGESDRTPGGLYIPAIAQDKPAKGKVIATGTGGVNKKGKLRPLDVKAGDSVVYSPYSGSKVTLSGQEYVILKESDVLGVLKN